MNLSQMRDHVKNKDNFNSIQAYSDFCSYFLDFIYNEANRQAVIVSQNEYKYKFFQYKEDGTYNVTRPINSDLMLSADDFQKNISIFNALLRDPRSIDAKDMVNRAVLNNFVYTCQQSIGATLDALPSNESNTARKINGDLFERFIRLIISQTGVDVEDGTVMVPIKVDGEEAFNMKYQHDLIISINEEIKAIGSVKTSSKDRIDKIFIDKFLYNKLTETDTPHFAIFLNDVQRKGVEGKYGISSTFLPGHFKGYTVKLNPLDGVYYFDIRPNMRTENILKDHIKTFDHFITTDVWEFIK